MLRRLPWKLIVVVVAVAVITDSVGSGTALAQRKGRRNKAEQQPAAGKPADYRSKNFLLHTDLSAQQAQELLGKLETMLSLISKYWARPNRKTIEVYAVEDLKNWPRGSLDPIGAQSVAGGGGVTISRTLKVGNSLHAQAVSYAVAKGGTPLHESVHAYCSQTFGTTGPVWYSEGMAEMGNYWREDDSSVNCEPQVVHYLRNTEIKSLNEIVNGRSQTGDSWQNYSWRWALCHLLANNENYRDRFRPLGLGLLTGQNVSFEQVYGSMAQEISFEYRFFIDHLDIGFRADLCSWDWKTKSRPPRSRRPSVARVEAARGWQSSRLRIRKGQEFEFTATGAWQLAEDGPDVTADGESSGRGRLMAVVYDDYQLGEPFELGVGGSFVVPSDGTLFLRCGDDWTSLADNSGRMNVKLKLAQGEERKRRSRRSAARTP